MAQIVLDQTQDISGRDIHRLTSLFPPPDFVKAANEERLCGDAEALPPHCYADPTHKLYPHHSAPATWMSSLFLLDKAAEFKPDEVALMTAALDRAAAHFGITSQITELRERHGAKVGDELTKLSNDQFAVVWANDDGTFERHWPLRGALEVKAASDNFVKNRDDFKFADRNMVADRILDKALEFGAAVDSDVLCKSAGRGACSARDAADFVSRRARLVEGKDRELAIELEKMAESIRVNHEKARGRETLIKLATVIDGIDRAVGLVRRYGVDVERPEDVLFRVTEKVAQDFVRANVETLTGNIYALDELEKASIDGLRDWMGDEFAQAVGVGDVFVDGTKLAAILPTLDRGMAQMFDRCMAELRISPVMQQKAAEAVGPLSGDRLYAAAQDYILQ